MNYLKQFPSDLVQSKLLYVTFLIETSSGHAILVFKRCLVMTCVRKTSGYHVRRV